LSFNQYLEKQIALYGNISNIQGHCPNMAGTITCYGFIVIKRRASLVQANDEGRNRVLARETLKGRLITKE